MCTRVVSPAFFHLGFQLLHCSNLRHSPRRRQKSWSCSIFSIKCVGVRNDFDETVSEFHEVLRRNMLQKVVFALLRAKRFSAADCTSRKKLVENYSLLRLRLDSFFYHSQPREAWSSQVVGRRTTTCRSTRAWNSITPSSRTKSSGTRRRCLPSSPPR